MIKKRKNYKKENKILIQIVKDIIWMAVRYAHGKKEALVMKNILKILKKDFNLYLKYDVVIDESDIKGIYSLKNYIGDKNRIENLYLINNDSEHIRTHAKQIRNYEYQLKILQNIVKIIFPFAVKYAHGRSTYAPSMVRDAMIEFKKICPDYKYQDTTILPPTHELKGVDFRSDYLDDLLDCSL